MRPSSINPKQSRGNTPDSYLSIYDVLDTSIDIVDQEVLFKVALVYLLEYTSS